MYGVCWPEGETDPASAKISGERFSPDEPSSLLRRASPSSSGAEKVVAIDTNVARESRLRSVIASATDTDESSAALERRLVIWYSAGGGSFPNICEEHERSKVSFNVQHNHKIGQCVHCEGEVI